LTVPGARMPIVLRCRRAYSIVKRAFE
jgi:hypothetical protein